MTALRHGLALMLAGTLAVTGCGRAGTPAPASAAAPVGHVSKVLIIAEENHRYDQIIGARAAPYINQLARTYGIATHLDAGYPASCPSLAAYILLTSGTTAGICDDQSPKHHRLSGDNVFHQVAARGREWRDYAESAPGPCTVNSSADGRYLVRHVPATYYLDVRRDCARWAVPMGTPRAGALHHDIAAGALPAFGFVSPDACNDMHGARPCPLNRVANGDRWLRSWLPSVFAGPDYRAGRLAVVITWDEGTTTDNHIPTLVISPRTRHIASSQAFTHCSTLRTTEELLRLPLLGCAARAPSMVSAFRL
jgi:phosphatidylinositol-3-phosphatase